MISKPLVIRLSYFEALIMNGRYREAVAMQQHFLSIADRLGDNRSKLYVLGAKLIVSTLIVPMPLT